MNDINPDISAQHTAAPVSPAQRNKIQADLAIAQDQLAQSQADLEALDKRLETLQYKKKVMGDLYLFATEVMGFGEMYEPLHRPLCDLVTDPTKLRKMILIPRGHFKTTIISICYPLWLLVNDPTKRIALCSNNVDKAKENLEEIIVRANRPEFLALFRGEIGSPEEWPKNTSEQIRVKRRGAKTGPSIAVYGVGSSEVGRHFDHMLIDDMVGNKEVDSSELREKVWRWFFRQLAVLDPGKEMLVLGTRWHDDDPYSRIKKLSKWFIKEMVVEEDGVFIFPTRFNKEFMDEIKETMDDYTISCFYYNKPSGSELNPFEVDKFSFIDYKREKIRNQVYTYIVVDPANTKKTYSCPAGILVVDALPNARHKKKGKFVIVEAILQKVVPDELVDLLFELVEREKPRAVIIEAEAQQNTYSAWMKREMLHRGLNFRILEITNQRDRTKPARLRALQPFLHRHQIIMDKKMPGKADFIREFETYGHAKDDDLVVATSFIPQKLANPPCWRRPDIKPSEVPLRSRFLQTLIDRQDTGRGRMPRIKVGGEALWQS